MAEASQRTVKHEIERCVAQAAVGRVPIRDVLLSLRRSRVILRFRVTRSTVVIEAERVLPLLFEVHGGA